VEHHGFTRHQEQGDALPVHAGRHDEVGGTRSAGHHHLAAVQHPAACRFARLGRDAVQFEAAARLAVGQQRDGAAVGNAAEQAFAPRVEAGRVTTLDQACGEHRAADEGLQRDAAAQLLRDQGGLHETAAHASQFFRNGQRQPAHFGVLRPARGRPAAIGRPLAPGLEAILLAHEARSGFAQHLLFVGEVEVHFS